MLVAAGFERVVRVAYVYSATESALVRCSPEGEGRLDARCSPARGRPSLMKRLAAAPPPGLRPAAAALAWPFLCYSSVGLRNLFGIQNRPTGGPCSVPAGGSLPHGVAGHLWQGWKERCTFELTGTNQRLGIGRGGVLCSGALRSTVSFSCFCHWPFLTDITTRGVINTKQPNLLIKMGLILVT